MLINQCFRSNKLVPNLVPILCRYCVSYCNIWKIFVRVRGLEPTRPKAPEPKSGASTNFATPALKYVIVTIMKITIKETTFINF